MDFKELFINFDNYNNRDSLTVDDFIKLIVKRTMEEITKPEVKTIKNDKTKKGKGETTKDKKE